MRERPGRFRRMLTKVAVVSMAGSLALMGAGAGPASSHSSDSRVSLQVDDRTVRPRQVVIFFGRLVQEHRRCRDDQKVILKRRGTGIIQIDRTDSEGEFLFKVDPRPNRGRYFARYRGRGGFGYGGVHSCSRASSRTIRITPAS